MFNHPNGASKLALATAALLLVGAAVFALLPKKQVPRPPLTGTPAADSSQSSTVNSTTNKKAFFLPLDNTRDRITKKPFGIKISPLASPVSPERFSGYHTGVDFETFPDEEKTDVPVSAVCTGPLKEKRRATGYGGLAVQQCELDGNPITVVYGHLKLGSITEKPGTVITAGDQIGILGQGYSQETDGERKHLHLGIHIGTAVNIRGYVNKQSELNGWIDPQKYLP